MNELTLPEFFRNKWVRLVLIADVLVIIAMIAVAIFKATKTATVILNVVPRDSKISLNGNSDYHNGTFQLAPGNYKVEISHDDLDTKTFDINIGNNEIARVTTFLTSNGNIDFYKRKNEFGTFLDLKEIASFGNNSTTDQDTSAEETIRLLDNAYQAALNNLPINDAEYGEDGSSRTGQSLTRDITIRLGRSDECETWLCLDALMALTNDKSIVAELLSKKGLKAEDYEIVYKIY